MTDTTNVDYVFQRIDQAIAGLEEEGFPFEFVCEVLNDYLELADEYLL